MEEAVASSSQSPHQTISIPNPVPVFLKKYVFAKKPKTTTIKKAPIIIRSVLIGNFFFSVSTYKWYHIS